jgi:hypothetical protein
MAATHTSANFCRIVIRSEHRHGMMARENIPSSNKILPTVNDAAAEKHIKSLLICGVYKRLLYQEAKEGI